MLDTGNSGIGPTGGLKFESRLYPSTSDKRNPLAICIGSGSQRRLLQLQTVREIHACFWDTLVEAPRDSGKTTLLSQPGKHYNFNERQGQKIEFPLAGVNPKYLQAHVYNEHSSKE
jgi:hypothetical protein